MPKKRDEELEFDFEDGSSEEEYAEDEGYEDDDEYSADDDDEYEDDEDEAPAGGGWMRKALFAVAGVVAIGAGTFAYFQGMLPFSPKAPVVVESSGPWANSNHLGKVVPAAKPGVPSLSEATGKASTSEPVKTAEAPAEPPKAKPATEQTVAVKTNQQPVAAPAAKEPVKVAAKAPVKAAPVAVPVRPVAQPPAAAPAALQPAGTGRYAIQCGAFASQTNATNLAHMLTGRGFPAWVNSGAAAPASAFSVRSTVVNSRRKAEALKSRFASAGHPAAVVPAGRGRYVLQLGIFSARDRAEILATELKSKGMFVSVSGGTARLKTPAKVMVGKYATQGQAQAACGKVRHQGVPAIVVTL